MAAEDARVAVAWVRARCPSLEVAGELRDVFRSGVVLWRLVETLGIAVRGTKGPTKVDDAALGDRSAAGSVARLRAYENVDASLRALERRGVRVLSRAGVDAHDVVNARDDSPALSVVFAITARAMRDEAESRDVSRASILEFQRERGFATGRGGMPLVALEALSPSSSHSDSEDDAAPSEGMSDARLRRLLAPRHGAREDLEAAENAMRALDPDQLLQVALAAGEIADDREARRRDARFRGWLDAFYAEHNPAKVAAVDAILAKYRGREADLVRQLHRKYAPEAPKDDDAAAAAALDRRVRDVLEGLCRPFPEPRPRSPASDDAVATPGKRRQRAPLSILRPPPHNDIAPDVAPEPTKITIKCLDTNEVAVVTPEALEKTGGIVVADSENARRFRRGLSLWNADADAALAAALLRGEAPPPEASPPRR